MTITPTACSMVSDCSMDASNGLLGCAAHEMRPEYYRRSSGDGRKG
jgi:hypothetical protein